MSIRQANRIETLNKILEAAEQEFGLHGYSGASLQSIADQAGLPKANIVYYFQSKENLYKKVLNKIITGWNDVFAKATIDDDPAVVLDQFIRTKLEYSFTKGRSSRIFAMEVLGGAYHISDYLKEELGPWFESRIGLINAWIQAGKMGQVDPAALIYMIWATTQHYADFEFQIRALNKDQALSDEDKSKVGDTVSAIILAGCKLTPPDYA
ncbi:TetR family transcriptional regulator C-terminal domain-containing protein [Marinomonas epiphytica]